MKESNKQRGNVLFLILIAVALFAALSYAVTKSTSGGGNASAEKASLAATGLFNYSAQVKTAIMRMKINQGIGVGDIRLESDVYKRISGNVIPGALGSPADPSNYLFHAEGGGVTEQTFTDIAEPCAACSTGYIMPGHMLIIWSRPQWLGSATRNESIITFFGITQEVCEAVNKIEGIASPVPIININFTGRAIGTNFDGNVVGATPDTNALTNLTDGATGIEGHSTWCVFDDLFDRYVYMDVIDVN